MFKSKCIAALTCIMLAGAFCQSDCNAAEQKRSTRHSQSASYISDKEIAFEMNSATGFVRIPAEYNWVKTYSLGVFNSPVVKNRIDVSDQNYRFTANIEELRKMCGSGSRRLPIKTKIIDRRSKKEKSFHITRLMVRFRSKGGADVQVQGYIFDK